MKKNKNIYSNIISKMDLSSKAKRALAVGVVAGVGTQLIYTVFLLAILF